MKWSLAGLSFGAAFVLFFLEFIIAKMMLPHFGGSSYVWAISLFFFNFALWLGYILAHEVFLKISRKGQIIFYSGLLLLGLLFFPLKLHLFAGIPPAGQVLLAIATSMAVPFIALAMTSPLLQAWGPSLLHGQTPYFLYAFSNAGSLAALIIFPLVLEPHLTTTQINGSLTVTYLLLLILLFILAIYLWPRKNGSCVTHPAPKPPISPAAEVAPLPSSATHSSSSSREERLAWFLFSTAAVALMVATTHMSTLDIGQMPLLWAIPLGIYLLAIILNFKERPLYAKWPLLVLAVLFIILKLLELFNVEAFPIMRALLAYYCLLFIGTMWAYRQLYLLRPTAKTAITRYYLYQALGGMAGSFILALGVPTIFRYSSIRNLDLVVALVIFFAAMLWQMRAKMAFGRMIFFFAFLLLGIAAIGLMHHEVFNLRNFYGQYAVYEQDHELLLASGTTIHGRQSLKPGEEQVPALYYHRQGPFGDLWQTLPGTKLKEVASIGLGIGSLLTYATPAQTWDVYELDPDIAFIAQKYFTHCAQAQGKINYFFGDGRLEIQKSPKKYDLIILDAFSSDSIPTHLLTQEALQIYLAHLNPGGVISFHISNNYLNIIRLLTSTAEDMQLAYAWKGQSIAGQGPSEWLVLENHPHVTSQLKAQHAWATTSPWPKVRPWHDDYASILPIISWQNN